MTALLVVLAVAAVVAAVAAAAAIAATQARRQARDNQVVAGRPTRAPRSWAGSHTAEARLHRRLRDAVRALAGLGGVDAATRAEVERHVADLDDRLVAVASLPPDERAGPLGVLAEQVAAVEAAVGAFATDGLDGTTDPGTGLATLSERLDALAAAHAELDALERRAAPTDLDALTDHLDAERDARASAASDAPAAASAPAEPPTSEQGRPQPGTG